MSTCPFENIRVYLVQQPSVSRRGCFWELINLVAEIVPNQGSVRIKVHVLRLWKVPSFLNPSEISSIEMVLIDDKGVKIHASIRKHHNHDYEFLVGSGLRLRYLMVMQLVFLFFLIMT
ncbi:hypothetical protein P8452_25014 [Trifolium repens]|nr:hypothetical protein P8452_25014 [Trifolium repens]